MWMVSVERRDNIFLGWKHCLEIEISLCKILPTGVHAIARLVMCKPVQFYSVGRTSGYFIDVNVPGSGSIGVKGLLF